MQSGDRLAHFELLGLVGAGGMGEVHRARDTRLGRDVAIKVLPLEFAADPDRLRRFEQEARAIAALNHSNILAIYDVGTHDGAPYIVTELLEGESLRESLDRGALPVRKAIELAVQIAQGLAAAHEKGIIHRDLKPANIFITREGHAKILDFGLAKVEPPHSVEEQSVTRTIVEATKAGAVLGTLAYMSPEQVRGLRVDYRSDIFSFGCVLYEMLAGRRPFSAATDADMVVAILSADPFPLAEADTEIPQGLNATVLRCLEKRSEDRFTSARDIAFALLAFAQPSGTLGRTSSVVDTTRDGRPSLAVLPFTNLSSDPDQEFFGDGLAEDIIDALTHVPGLRVMARTSAFAFRGKEQDVRRIGAQLNVGHILEGSVRRAGSRLRVTAQLVNASDGYHLWSERFDTDMTDIFAIQDEISQAIVEKLRVQLTVARPLVKRHTENVEAYQLFLRGHHCVFRMTLESIERGRQYLEQAIALDPDYALAHAGMAEYYFMSAYWGDRGPREIFPRCKAAALEALNRDDGLAEAHLMLGVARGIGDFDWAAAKPEFSRALALNPESPTVHYVCGFWYLRPIGRTDEAISEVQRAVELDPLSAFYNNLLAYLYYVTEQNDLAIAQYQRALDLDPGWYFPHWLLAIAYQQWGRIEEGICEAEKACGLSERNSLTLAILGLGYGLAGREKEAKTVLEELTTRRRAAYVSSWAMSAACRGAGAMEQALEWLEQGIEEHDVIEVSGLKTDPRYARMHGHPRYQAMLRRMNLEP